ncbi:MAG: dipeptide/oligopeptide/nickel ABC transporter permease/ATP-binding protein [Anaerolineales bacterium]|nr:dipeptide/oligopeptide/nickel ABC transporter permease/ATP-binding protein [Anaerolineales bacterium]
MSVSLVLGLITLAAIVVLGAVGPLFVNPKLARVGGVKANLAPSAQYLLGTDSQGRDVLTTLVMAIPPTIKTGLIAGTVSVLLGLALGLVSGFYSGWIDGLIRTLSDVLMAVPVVAILILIVARMEEPDINLVALAIALLTWSGTARGIRAQVLTLREHTYIQVARANGASNLEVLFGEILPNLLPLLMATFIGAITAGIYSVMALEVLGLGSNDVPTLGMMIFWSQRMSAVLRGMVWWWSPPIFTIALIFIGLFLTSQGLDHFVNPTLAAVRRSRGGKRPLPAAARALPQPSRDSSLAVIALKVVYETPAGPAEAVSAVTFTLQAGERLGLIGESGSGKSTLAMAVLRLLRPPGQVTDGAVLFEGRDLVTLPESELRKLRLKEIALMPQAAMNSLNPVMPVGAQIRDALAAHDPKLSKRALDDRIAEVLTKVGLRPDVARRYPHQLSGGMKQRIAMAIAIVMSPKVIIADEPTSALDVVVQQQVMRTLWQLQKQLGAAVLLIGHDLGLIAQFSDRIGVMYAGKLVEVGPVHDILNNPLHPYTRALVDTLPDLEGKQALVGIPGLAPELLRLPSGCAFHPRCAFALDRCRQDVPQLQSLGGARQVACHLYPDRAALPAVEGRTPQPAEMVE